MDINGNDSQLFYLLEHVVLVIYKKKTIEALSRSIHMCYCLQSSLLIATLLKSLPEKKMDV